VNRAENGGKVPLMRGWLQKETRGMFTVRCSDRIAHASLTVVHGLSDICRQDTYTLTLRVQVVHKIVCAVSPHADVYSYKMYKHAEPARFHNCFWALHRHDKLVCVGLARPCVDMPAMILQAANKQI
jgi:hypothetical protein